MTTDVRRNRFRPAQIRNPDDIKLEDKPRVMINCQ